MIAFGRALRVDLRRAICSKVFILSAVLLLLWQFMNCINILPSAYFWSESNTVSMVYVLNFAVTDTSAFAPLLLPIGAVPYACSFLTDRESGFEAQAVERVGTRTYGVSKVVSTAVSSFLAVTAAIVLFLGILYLGGMQELPKYPLGNSQYYALVDEGHVYLFYLVRTVITGLGAALAGVVSMTISAFVANAYVALLAPLLIYYAYWVVQSMIPHSGWFSLYAVLFGQPITHAGLSFLWSVVFLLTLIVLCGRLFLWRLRKEQGE